MCTCDLIEAVAVIAVAIWNARRQSNQPPPATVRVDINMSLTIDSVGSPKGTQSGGSACEVAASDNRDG